MTIEIIEDIMVNLATYLSIPAVMADDDGDKETGDYFAWKLLNAPGSNGTIVSETQNPDPNIPEITRETACPVQAIVVIQFCSKDEMSPWSYASDARHYFSDETLIEATLFSKNVDPLVVNGPKSETVYLNDVVYEYRTSLTLRLSGRDVHSSTVGQFTTFDIPGVVN